MREQNASALKIQSYYRSYSARKKAKNVLRDDFEILRTKYKSGDDKTREELVSHLLFFYHKDHDVSRLVNTTLYHFACFQINPIGFTDLVLSNLRERTKQSFEFFKVIHL